MRRRCALSRVVAAARSFVVTAALTITVVAVAQAAPAARGLAIRINDSAGKEVGLYKESHALVIGASGYTNGWPKLPGATKDVAAVKELLASQGFAVEVVADPTRDQLEKAFAEFINRWGLKPENRLLFYYAGHGHTLKQSYGEEMGYLVPVDAPNPNTDREGFLARAVDMQQIEGFAKRIQARHALFLFDSCFSGQIFALSRAVPESISYKTGQPVRQFITSGSAEEQVPDRSIFREQLAAALGGEGDLNHDGYVTGTELGEFLQDTVVNYSKNAQHPQYGKIRNPNLDKGDYVFQLAGGGSVVTEEAVPATPAKAAEGSLTVRTNPAGAAVTVNGARRGAAPLTVEKLAPGQVTVRAELEGYDAQERTVLIRAGKATALTLVLEKTITTGSLAVTSEPAGAEWYLDNVYVGTTPETLPEVAPGTHRVTLKKMGYEEWTGSVTVRVGEEAQASASLREKSKPAPAAPAAATRPPSPAGGGQGEGGTSPAQTWREPTTGMEFVWIPGGEFDMGSNDGSGDEKPVHRVRVDGFWMGKSEVTQGQWKGVMRGNPSHFSSCGDSCPVEKVTWDDAQEFIRKLASQSGKQYRLPTEAEWEYAAGGGAVHQKWAGTDSESELGEYAWYSSNWGSQTQPVCQKRPNAFGLCDMSGNVWEWCEDWYGTYSSGSQHNSTGPSSGSNCVSRGGGWGSGPGVARSAHRGGYAPGGRHSYLGFRLVLPPGQR